MMKQTGWFLFSLLSFLPDLASAAGVGCPELTWGQKAIGFISLMGILKVGAIGLGAACFCYLFWDIVKEFVKIFLKVPVWVYEVLAYALSGGLIIAGLFVSRINELWFALPGFLVCPLALCLTAMLHNIKPNSKRFFAALLAVWAPVAMLYDNTVLGFLAVSALMGLVGFSVWITPLCYAFGFEDEDALGKATATGFWILAVFIVLRMLGIHPDFISVFEPGAFWLGSFVGFLGLLIASAKWYSAKFPYGLMNVLMILAGIAGLVTGTMWDIAPLMGISGTFFVLWAIEKPFEIPCQHLRSYAYIGLLVSIAVGFGVYFAQNHMDVIGPYLLF